MADSKLEQHAKNLATQFGHTESDPSRRAHVKYIWSILKTGRAPTAPPPGYGTPENLDFTREPTLDRIPDDVPGTQAFTTPILR